MNWTRKATKAVTLSLATGLIVGAGSFATSAAPVAGVSGAINTASVKSVKSIEDAANDTKGSSYNTRSGVSLLLSGIVSGANTSKNKSAAMMTAASEKNGTADERKSIWVYRCASSPRKTRGDIFALLPPEVPKADYGNWRQGVSSV